ncbi:MAG: zinc ribbon-containing protein [Actinomycetota bacterium]|nr:zinc ribbon-containing protein [Actinomycetota bacterium]
MDQPAAYANSETQMVDLIRTGSHVSSGTYRCSYCGYDVELTSMNDLPPCPWCGHGTYDRVRDGDNEAEATPQPVTG